MPNLDPDYDDEREAAWRKAIADQVRRNCTPSSEAYSKGGDALIYAVCDWIENPPEWSRFETPRRQGPITDAQVEAARKAFIRASGLGWIAAPDIRAALEAARDVS